jgi:GT2 family glycosyltransferase
VSVPLLSLVLLGYQKFEQTSSPCLESLRPWFDDPEIEVLALDNASPDGSGERMRRWCAAYPSVSFMQSEYNRGFAGGMNWGAQQARGQWLLLVNSDTEFAPQALDALKPVLRQVSSKVAMIGPVTNAAGNGQRLWRPEADKEEWLRIGATLHACPSGHLMPAYRCDFFCIAIRADVWRQLGGLDLAFGLGYYEDFDFSLRLRKAGWEQAITEDVFVYHQGSASFMASKEARALMKHNKKLLQAKHKDAQFDHTRLGNLQVMQEYQRLKLAGKWTEQLEQRWILRIRALAGDTPRRWWKSWMWRKRIAGFF